MYVTLARDREKTDEERREGEGRRGRGGGREEEASEAREGNQWPASPPFPFPSPSSPPPPHLPSPPRNPEPQTAPPFPFPSPFRFDDDDVVASSSLKENLRQGYRRVWRICSAWIHLLLFIIIIVWGMDPNDSPDVLEEVIAKNIMLFALQPF